MAGDVQLTIGKEIVTPIVEAKVKAAIIEAMGGFDKVVEKVIERILYEKVNSSGQVSQYSSDNKNTWLDVVVTKQIQESVKNELVAVIGEATGPIRDALVANIRTKAGANMIAKALINGLDESFKNSWKSTFEIKFENTK